MIRCVIAVLLCAFSLQAQTRISGVVNIYTPVRSIPLTCSQDVVVEQPYGFKPGDRVLIIQMMGASINTTDTPQFGDIVSLGSCGNLEYGNIKAVNGNVITLVTRLVNSYDVSAAVQLVRVAVYVNVMISGDVRARPWDGRTGGVVAIEASGTVTFQADIDVNAQGFSGGIRSLNYASCSRTGYAYTLASGYGAQKGDGVALSAVAYEAGRGKLGNGGGGGVDHNSGGGGGGNAAAGGRGGDQWVGCSRVISNGAIGGLALPYARNFAKIFLGGGGGGGHQNNGVGTGGAPGGGIVILRAGSIEGANRAITAAGASVGPIAGNDGAGGGGAGGTIWIDCAQFTTPLRAIVTGGAGGSASTTAAHGVGGGGGGGAVLSPLFARSPLLQVQLQGGSTGYNVPFRNTADSNLKATPGGQGLYIEGFNIPEGAFSLQPITVKATPDTIVCTGTVVTCIARAQGGTGNYTITWRKLNGQIENFGASIQYGVVVPTQLIVSVADDAGCVGEDTVTIDVLRAPRVRVSQVDVGMLSPCRSWRDTSILVENLDTVSITIASVAPQSPSITTPGLPTLPLLIPVGGSIRIPIRMITLPKGAFMLPVLVMVRSCDTILTTFIRGTSATVATALTPDSVVLPPSPSCDPVRVVKSLTFTNRSSVDVTIPTIISNGQLSTIGPTFPRTVQAGATLTITVEFRPTLANQGATLKVPWNAAGCEDTLTSVFVANIQPSAWTVSDTVLDFGHVLECDAERDTTVVIRNDGIDPMTFTMIPRGPLSYSNIVSPTFTLQPNESFTIPFNVHPIGVGAQTGVFKIVSATCQDTITIMLRIVVDSVRFIVPDTLSFGTIISCRERSRSQPIPIANVSSDGVLGTVEGFAIGSPFSWSVRVGDTISTMSDLAATILFEPERDGDFLDSIVLDMGPCSRRSVLYMRGKRVSATLEGTPLLAFPLRSIGDTSLLRAYYVNTGSGDLTVTTVQAPPQPFYLASIQPSLPAVLQPGDTLSIDVTAASIPGSFSSQISVLSNDPCNLSATTLLTVSAFGRTTVHVPRLTGQVGQVVNVPVILDSIEGVQDSLLRTFQCVVQFNSSVLAPMMEGGLESVTREVQTFDTLVSVRCSGRWSGGDTLAVIPCTVLLALDKSVPLDLSDASPFAWGEVPTEVIQLDGLLDVREVCAGRDLRMVRLVGGLRTVKIVPNPVQEIMNIWYESTTAAEGTLRIVDATGRNILQTELTLELGTHVVPVSVEHIAVGSYTVLLHVGTVDSTFSMIITR